MEEGDRLRALGDLRGALRLYRALQSVAPTAALQQRIAETEDALVRHGAAYDAYIELLSRYGTGLPATVRTHAEHRIEVLSGLTGMVSLVGGEPGTEIRVDGELVGVTPLSRPLRLTRGERRLDLSKNGFEVRTLSVSVSDLPQQVSAELTPYVLTGTLEVRGTTSDFAELYVDGQRVGPLPISLELAAGNHQISAVGPAVISSVLRVVIARRQRTSIAVDLFPRPGEVDIDAAVTEALIVVDGVVVGQGRYRGALPAGRHEVELRRRGYNSQRQTVQLEPGRLASVRAGAYVLLGPSAAEAPTAALPTDADHRAVEAEEKEDPYNGFYGSLIVPVMLAGASTHSYQSECPAASFEGGSCTASAPKGGGLGLRLGYAFLDWFGVEAIAAGVFDVTTSRFTIPADVVAAPGSPINQDLIDLAGRSAFVRAGGLLGAGVRVTTPIQGIRFTVGASYVYIPRRVFAIPDSFAGVNLTYSVPGWFVDGGVQLGDTPGGRLYLGAFLLMEQAHDLPLSRDLSQLQLGEYETQVAEELTRMTIYRGRQYFFGPLIGIAFGH